MNSNGKQSKLLRIARRRQVRRNGHNVRCWDGMQRQNARGYETPSCTCVKPKG